MKRLLRLFVMTQLRHEENYFINAMKSNGIDVTQLSHNQVALYKAQIKQIEADLLIETAFKKEKTSRSDFDYSILLGGK